MSLYQIIMYFAIHFMQDCQLMMKLAYFFFHSYMYLYVLFPAYDMCYMCRWLGRRGHHTYVYLQVPTAPVQRTDTQVTV